MSGKAIDIALSFVLCFNLMDIIWGILVVLGSNWQHNRSADSTKKRGGAIKKDFVVFFFFNCSFCYL